MAGNRWATGMADILMVDWYPVETSNNGCSRTGTHYISTGPKHFTNVKNDRRPQDARDARLADGPDPQEPEPDAATRSRDRPRRSCAARSARRFRYLGATGFAFHTWSNSNYAS